MAITTVTTAGYLGLLFQQIKRPNAMLKMAGRFAGQTVGETFAYKASTSREFPIGAFYSVPAPAQPAVLEGSNAPAPSTTSLTQTTNVIQLHQETVSVSYLAESDKTISGVVPIPQGSAGGQNEVQNPRSMEFQIKVKLQKIAQDMNYSFLNGAYANPANPAATALQTRGVVTCIATNISNQSGVAANTITGAVLRGYVDALLSSMVTYNGYMIDENFVMFAGPADLLNIMNAYKAVGTIFLNPDEKIVGLQVRKIYTAYGTIVLVMEPDMAAGTVLIAKMDEVGIVGLEVPNKGVVFEEPLYKQGSADQTQIYGQVGIDHGPEYYHGKLVLPAGVSIPS